MNDKAAKKARSYARSLIGAKPNENGAIDWAEAWLRCAITPKQRRRAEALAVRKSAKKRPVVSGVTP
jgi:hypothetical protein